jgi:cyclic dehypoxanthinyl futalosine synthase
MIVKMEEKIRRGERLSRDEAQSLFLHASRDELKQLATLAKSRYHAIDEATYLIMAIINYTNICVAGCDYCAFYRYPHEKGAYLKDLEEMRPAIDQVAALGGTLVAFNGGFHPKLHIRDYVELFQKIHAAYPEMTFFEMTVAEFLFASRVSKMPLAEAAQALKAAGTRWITGGGAEVLDDRFRKRHSPGKFTVREYFEAQGAVLQAGLDTTATMVIGFDETLEERFNHLEALRQFQDAQDRPVKSFLCWTYKPFNNKLGGHELSTEEYLRWLAISRLYLDNIEHIRTSVLTKNEAALEGLQFGANDFDLPVEDEVTQKAGAEVSHDFAAILQSAKHYGFTPVHRSPF